MNKKVVVVLLCISSHIIGMEGPFLSYSNTNSLLIFDCDRCKGTVLLSNSSNCHRCRTAQLSDYESKCILSTILGYVKCNAVDYLQGYLKYHSKRMLYNCMDQVEKDRQGSISLSPDVLQRVLRHPSSAPILHEAVKRSYNCCAELLFVYKAHPNIAIEGGDTPLHVAKNSSIVQLLIEHGAWIEQKNDCGETPFFKCIKNSCLDMAQILYDAGADVNASNKDGNTPLHYAAKYSPQGAIIQFLLYRGASIDCKNKLGQTAYQIICKRGGVVLKAFREWEKVVRVISFTLRSLNVVSLLDCNGRQLKKLLTCDTSNYCSPDIVVAEKLFKRCSDEIWNALKKVYSAEVLSLVKCVKERSEYRKYFLVALRNDDFFSAHQLLQENPYALHTFEGEYEKDEVNALFVEKVISSCAKNDQYPYLQKMIYSGCFDIDSCDDMGIPVLSAVIQQSDSGDKYLDLLKAGAYVNKKDKYGNTPLFYAVMLEDKNMIFNVLLYGAVVNKDFAESFNLPDEMWKLMNDAYGKQKCVRCGTHDHDLSSIPCVNRHLRHFICTQCYDKNSQKRCPLCRRSMGAFGL